MVAVHYFPKDPGQSWIRSYGVVKAATKRALWTGAGGICSFPFCYLLCDVSATIGTVAHIVSAKSGGPRYDRCFPPNEIDDLGNLILLCENHHRLVDRKEQTYSTERLRRWKREHESRVDQLVRSYFQKASRGLRTALEKSGYFCARCKCRRQIPLLVVDALVNTVTLIESTGLPDDLTYENLIVFCPDHKTEVEDNRERFPPDVLRKLKAKREEAERASAEYDRQMAIDAD